VIRLNLFKTFPLKLGLEFHKRIKLAAVKSGETIEHFIIKAIKEKLTREEKSEI